MNGDAVGSCLNDLIDPKGMGWIVVQDNLSPGADKELSCYLIGDVLTLVDEQAVTGRAMHLSGIVHREEFQD